MQTVYMKAQTVQAWLGEPIAEERLAMETCRAMYSDKTLSLDFYRAQALIDLFRKPYWTRLWVI